MTYLLTAAQMRAIERTAIDGGDVTGLELMERAGAGIVEAILKTWPAMADSPGHAAVLCGPGNNGGDGFVVARLLKRRGWDVEAYLYGDASKLPPDAAENAGRWREMGEIQPLRDADFEGRFNPSLGDTRRRFTLVVDALFGIGLTRPVDLPLLLEELGAAAALAREEPDRYPLVAAVDTPSGLCADSGRILGIAAEDAEPRANLTITFQTPKLGHFIADGPTVCGGLAVVDLGLGEPGIRRALVKLHGTEKIGRHLVGLDPLSDNAQFYGTPDARAHKYSHGHAVIVSGGASKTGAARLAARGALRVGAGLVTVASPPNALMENAAHLTAIMVSRIEGAEGLASLLADPRLNAVALGPGCGVGEETRAMVRAALGQATPERRTAVLDADALTSFRDDPDALFAAIADSSCEAILTPHDGEFARLFPDLAVKLEAVPETGPAFSRVDAAREAAARSGATVLLKGPDTVIASPAGVCSVVAAVRDRAAPWLASAGSGDVLTGMIAGLAARGTSDAAASATWLHQECGREIGPGLIAEDIPEAIPSVLKRLLRWEPPGPTQGS